MAKHKETLLLGAHLSIAGGLHNALVLAGKLRCNCVQLFLKNQRQWKARDLDKASVELWCQTRRAMGDEVRHVIGHSAYLINLASDNLKTRQLSKVALEQELSRCEILGVDRLVMHPGSHRGQGTDKGVQLVAEALGDSLRKVHGVTLLLEITAGAGDCLGASVEELAEIIDACRCPDRLGICLDTCHLFAGGHALHPKVELERLLAKVDTRIGLSRLGCIHLNDSFGGLGSHLDRHEHIGKGHIGLEAFRGILQNKQLTQVPKIIETPKGPDGDIRLDEKNLAVLRKAACLL